VAVVGAGAGACSRRVGPRRPAMPALVAGIRVFFWAWRCAAWAKSAAPRQRRAGLRASDGRVFAPSAGPTGASRSEEGQAARQAPPEPRSAGIWPRACPFDSFDGLARVLQ